MINKLIANRYRVESFLGKGGMAEVYKVWDTGRNVYLAMKILHADLAEDRVFLRRFKREAQTLETLQHPNIVRFYGLEQDSDLVYMLMDYVEGTTLRKEIFQSKEPLSLERILDVMKSICSALYYAHKSGIVHCDIKPANIMIQKNGNILVADFGISRMTEASTVTMVGAGTPAYMSPEQIKGDDPTPQMDIYALGIVLFEMLTGGERPFTGENAEATGTTSEKVRWEQMRLAAPPPSMYNPSIPTSMDEIVLKCLEKSPTSRYVSAVDLLSDLSQQIIQTETSIQPTPPVTQLVNSEPAPLPKETLGEKAQQTDLEPSAHEHSSEKKVIQISQPNKKRGRFVGFSMVIVIAALIGLGFFYNNSLVTQLITVSTPTRTSTPTPTQTPRPAATATPSCYGWNEINKDMIGKEVCAYGTLYVKRIMPYGGSRIFFDLNQSFFFVSSDNEFPNVKKGECVKGYGKVEVSAEKLLYINIKNALPYCN